MTNGLSLLNNQLACPNENTCRRRLAAKAVGLIAILLSARAFAYSQIALPAEDLAHLAVCVVQGVVTEQTPRRAGLVGIRTLNTIAVTKRSGDCPLGLEVHVDTYGGTLPTGEWANIAGIEAMVMGGEYILLLTPTVAAQPSTTVAGPQGIMRLVGTDFDTQLRDATGVTLQFDGDVSRGLSGAEKYIVSRRVSSNQIEAFASESATREAIVKRTGGLFERFAAGVLALDQAEKASFAIGLQNVLRGPEPGYIGVKNTLNGAETTIPISVSKSLEADKILSSDSIDCFPARCRNNKGGTGEVGRPASQLSPGASSTLPWSLAPTLQLGTQESIVLTLMAQWNAYANYFRTTTSPTNTYAPGNGLNDVGWFADSGELARLYGYSWPVIGNEYQGLGVTFTWDMGRGVESDIFLNPGISWTLDDASARVKVDGRHSIRQILMHELGHGLGLEHSGEPSIMAACVIGTRGAVPFADDAQGARARWPSLTQATGDIFVRFFNPIPTRTPCGLYSSATSTKNPAFQTEFNDTTVSRVGSTILVGPFMAENYATTAKSGAVVEWYLTENPRSFAGRAYQIGTTSLPTLLPGYNIQPGLNLQVPSGGVGGLYYLTSYIRSGAPSNGTDSALASYRVQLAGASQPTFIGKMTGTWWNPTRGGEGQTISFETTGSRNVVFLAWYTYDANGNASWLVGNVDYLPGTPNITIPLIRASGAKFGTAFRAADVRTAPAGTAVLEYVSCTQMRLRYSGLESFFIDLTRLIGPIEDAACP